MTKQDLKQEFWSDEWIKHKSGILHLEMRSGKCATTIKCFRKLNKKDLKILISYPDNKIKGSWEGDFQKFGYENPNVVFTNFSSLKKYTDTKFDVVVFDEINQLSDFEFEQAALIKNNSKYHIGLTGTISEKTRNEITEYLDLPVIVRYTKEQAIKDGIISDYKITIHTVPLDNKILIKQKSGKLITEKKQYDNTSFVIEKLKREKKDFAFLAIKRAGIIKNSSSKLEYIKKLLHKYKDDRCLVFMGSIKQAEALNIPVYHSKSESADDFDSFISGYGKHQALIGIGKSGVTYRAIDRVIVGSYTANSEELEQVCSRIMLQEWEGKIANIDIIASTEKEDIKRLNQALINFDNSKIRWI